MCSVTRLQKGGLLGERREPHQSTRRLGATHAVCDADCSQGIVGSTKAPAHLRELHRDLGDVAVFRAKVSRDVAQEQFELGTSPLQILRVDKAVGPQSPGRKRLGVARSLPRCSELDRSINVRERILVPSRAARRIGKRLTRARHIEVFAAKVLFGKRQRGPELRIAFGRIPGATQCLAKGGASARRDLGVARRALGEGHSFTEGSETGFVVSLHDAVPSQRDQPLGEGRRVNDPVFRAVDALLEQRCAFGCFCDRRYFTPYF